MGDGDALRAVEPLRAVHHVSLAVRMCPCPVATTVGHRSASVPAQLDACAGGGPHQVDPNMGARQSPDDSSALKLSLDREQSLDVADSWALGPPPVLLNRRVRAVYRVEGTSLVEVIVIGKREDMEVYQLARAVIDRLGLT